MSPLGVVASAAALASGAGTRSRSTLRPCRGSIALAVRALKTRDGSRQKNDPFKEFEEPRVLCAFASRRECSVAVLWVRRSETNRPSKCLEDTRGEFARKGLTYRRMSNDSPKIQWSCQRVNEQVGVGIPRQFSGRDGLLDQVYIHGSSRQIETFEEQSPKHRIFLNITPSRRTMHQPFVQSRYSRRRPASRRSRTGGAHRGVRLPHERRCTGEEPQRNHAVE